jgi:hypothetical protein
LWVFLNRVLRRIFWPKVIGGWRRIYGKELYDLTPHPILFGLPNQEEWDGRGT